jgi:hypothetical protein
MVDVGISVGSEDLGTVMNFEPSLFVYFAVALEVGDVGVCVAGLDLAICCRWFAGIPACEWNNACCQRTNHA